MGEKSSEMNEDNVRLDLAILLEMLASPDEPDFPLVEEIADRNGFYFDEYGELVRKGDE